MDVLVNRHTTNEIASLMDTIDSRLSSLSTPDVDNSDVVEAIESLADKFEIPDTSEKIVKAISDIRFPEINFPNTISVDNFPPQKYPLPPTNININGLRGPVHSSAVSVGATATPLPTSPLENRRSLIVWNNDNSTTLWIGGSDVTVANGIPVKKQNYSPALDLSDRVTLYGITDGATIDVRVLESSMSDTGA